MRKKNTYTVLTIGDSFSEQGRIDYKNYLTKKDSISVLHIDRFLNRNPIQTLHGLINGNVFDSLHIKYIVLQSVERHFVKRAIRLNKAKIIDNDTLIALIKKEENKPKILLENKDILFSSKMPFCSFTI